MFKSSTESPRRPIVTSLLLASGIVWVLALHLSTQDRFSQEFYAIQEARVHLGSEFQRTLEQNKSSVAPEHEPARIRKSISALMPWGWQLGGLSEKIEGIKSRFNGMLVRPMSRREMELISPVLKSDAGLVKLVGRHLLNRPADEVERVSSGIISATSTGITDSARLELSSKIAPILEEWQSAPPRSSWLATLLIAVICILFPLFVATLLTRNGKDFGIYTAGFGELFASASLGASVSVLLAAAHWKITPIEPWLFTILLISAVSASLFTFPSLRAPIGKTFAFARAGIVLFVSLSMMVSGLAICSVIPVSEGGAQAALLTLTLSTLAMMWIGSRCHSSMVVMSTPLFSAATALAWSFVVSLVFFTSPQLLDAVWIVSKSPQLILSATSTTAAFLLSSFSFILVFIVKMVQYGKVPFSVSYEPKQSQPSHLAVVLSVTIFSLLGAFFTGNNIKMMEKIVPTAQAVSWETAVASSKEGTGMIVDSRAPGTHPEIPADALIDPDSSDEFLKDFCSFAAGRRIYVFCASSSCDISAILASRLSAFCPSGAFHIEGGAESWSLLK